MNVFRSRKKSVGDADVIRPSFENAPPLPKHSRTIFGRRRQQTEPEKKEIDLSTVLPTDNEFRTSLLMPNLAQRFSMLREQDDPNTKIGKASDDSVLFPKRASRLDLFGLGNLDDIEEVSSIAGSSFRPPFARDGRVTSYASDGYDGYASDTGSANGSIMGRMRPGQGNKLFGGRQKVYKISPAGPISKGNSRPGSSGNASSGRGMGRAVYEDDISSSLWQRLRSEEKAKRSFDYDPSLEAAEDRFSPSLNGYNRNRETSSSTNSAERVSTAATSMTSIADVNAGGSMVKDSGRDRLHNKKLYGQSMDQQMQDQQTSAIQRFNSGRGGRVFGTLTASRPGTQRPGAISAASSLRSGSPSPALNAGNAFDFGLDKLGLRDTDSGYHGSSSVPSPISPHHGMPDPTLAAHIDPNDYGKATASGAFNKPKAKYDDQQYLQRQMQLRETSQGPASRSETPSDRASSRLRQGSDSSVSKSITSTALYRSRGDQSITRDIHSRQRITPSGQSQRLVDSSDSEDSLSYSSQQQQGSETSSSRQGSHWSNDHNEPSSHSTAYPHDEQHPAFRTPINEEEEEYNAQYPQNGAPASKSVSGQPNSEYLSEGLNDMVRGHLRARSDASSVYSDTVPSYSAHHSHNNSTSETIPERAEPSENTRSTFQSGGQDAASRARALSTARKNGLALPLLEDSAHHARSPSNDTLLERDAFADELADRRRLVEEKLRNIAESRANFDGVSSTGRDDDSPGRGFGLLKKSASRSSLANEANASKMLKKFKPGSGSATPTTEEDYRDLDGAQRSNGRKLSDPRRPDTSSGSKPALGQRDIGAERRARHAANLSSPRGSGPPVRGNVEARKQQFAGGSGAMPKDFTERVNANPDQGKPHFHPAGRARHYSPPRANATPDQKPILPPQATQATLSSSQRSLNKSPNGRQAAASAEAASPQMLPSGATSPVGTIQYAAARKRSVSKVEISSPINLVSSTYALPTVDLSPGASLENGMDEVRAADAANPPPVPPINPRRRAKGALRMMSRSNSGSPESDDDGSRSPSLSLRKQVSEGSSLRGRIREKISSPTSPHRGH